MSRIATDWAWKQKNISQTQKIVLLALADRHNPDTGDCFPSIGRLADDCCMSESGIKKALNELVTLSLITKVERRVERGRNKTNQYELHLDNVIQGGGVIIEPLVGSRDDPETKLKKLPDTSYQGASAIDAFLEVAEETPVDNRKDFWDEAVGMMMAMGVVEVTARPFIGRILGWTRGDMAEALRVIDQALQAGTNNPIQYIAAIFTKKGTGKAAKKKEMDELFAQLKEASDARKAQWAAEEAAANAGGSGDEDTGVLSEREFDEPASVHADTHKRSGKVPAKRVAEVVRPAGGHLSDM
jgi:hypothetical protein